MRARDWLVAATYFCGALLIIHSVWQRFSRRPAPPEQISLFWGIFLLAVLVLCGFIIQMC
jgi:hypothetical protein